jgi:glyoxylase-like metal-dependent hydrolase (beta-lactamase superfamily II)
MKIIPVDCNYVEAEFATSYLLVQEVQGQKRGLFVECNTNHAIPFLIQAAEKEGLSRDQVDGLIITHVHLDHAGGAGLFLREFPKAKLYAHPRASRHAIDPSKLVASATQVYGKEFMDKLYGTILPCPADRVVVLEDGDDVHWAGGVLHTQHTRGHANHHLCIIEPETKTLFSGDAFGVSYPKINAKRGLLVLPSTSPTDFDGEAAIQTVEWIRDQDLNQVALTHYAFLKKDEIRPAAQELIDYLRFSMALVSRIQREKLSVEQTTERIHDWMIQYYAQKSIRLDSEDLKHLAIDFKVNAQGLVFTASKPAAH